MSRMMSQCDVITGTRRNVVAPRLHYPRQRVIRRVITEKIKLYAACHTLPRIIGNALVSRAYNRFITFNKYSNSSLTNTRIAVSMIAFEFVTYIIENFMISSRGTLNDFVSYIAGHFISTITLYSSSVLAYKSTTSPSQNSVCWSSEGASSGDFSSASGAFS